ncbi:MAG: hypothetical protein AABM66_08245 [Actinomycetota bacterium]
MSGPAPKQPSERRRRNPPAGGEWIELPATVEKPILPPLPRRSKGRWSTVTRATWEAWRIDPATTQYTPADISFALHTIRLVELGHAMPTAALLAEIRLRMDGLGLTAKGKRYLRWRVADPAEVVELARRKPRKRPHLMAAR